MKKFMSLASFVSLLAVLALASCTAETDAPLSTEPLLGTSSLDNTQITTETAPPVFTSAPIVRDMSNVTDEKELIELVNGYHENRRYDGIEEWYSEQQEKERKLRQILEAFLSRYDESGSTDVHNFVDSEMYDIMEELTKLAPPTPMKPLTIKQKWSTLFRETGDLVKTSIEQYFCK